MGSRSRIPAQIVARVDAALSKLAGTARARVMLIDGRTEVLPRNSAANGRETGMGTRRTRRAVLGGAIMILATGCVHLSRPPLLVEVANVSGRVEVMRPGQTDWARAAVGALLAEKDEIRAFAGGGAELKLPEGDAIFLTGGSRLIVVKLEPDADGRARTLAFYLPVGKVWVMIDHGSLERIQSGRLNVAIATPMSVAITKGSNMVVAFDPVRNTTVAANVLGPPRSGESLDQYARDEADCERLSIAAGQ